MASALWDNKGPAGIYRCCGINICSPCPAEGPRLGLSPSRARVTTGGWHQGRPHWFCIPVSAPGLCSVGNMDPSDWKALTSGAWRTIRLPEVWIMGVPIVLTLVVVLGPFVIADPRATFQQVFGSLTQRPAGDIPSYIGILFTLTYTPGIIRLYSCQSWLRCQFSTSCYGPALLRLSTTSLQLDWQYPWYLFNWSSMSREYLHRRMAFPRPRNSKPLHTYFWCL